MSDQQDTGSKDGSSGHNEPSQKHKKPRPLRPLRFMQSAVRLAQRENAKHDDHKRYRDTQETELANVLATLHYVFGRTHSNFWIAMFTAVLTVTTIAQWWVMGDQNRIMVDQIRLDQRPWLSFHNPSLDPIKAGSSITYTLHLKNSGRTPAWIKTAATTVVVDVTGKELDQEIGQIREWSQLQANELSVGPDTVLNLPAKPPMPTIGTEGQARIDLEAVKIYVVAYMTYSDFRKDMHWVLACFKYDPATQSLRMHDRYNDMDREGE